MTNKTMQVARQPLAAFLLLGAGTYALAQTAPAADTPTTDSATTEDVVVLSPFEVTSEGSSRYSATDTLAGTRVKTDLKDIASSISVVTAEFLRDTGSKNQQDLLVYTPNTEVGGVRGNFSGVGNDQAPALLRPQTNTRVRGLDAADNTRDYFLSDIPWDSYIVDRVDMQRGPNSILFGVGSPAGIINTSVNTANFKTGGKIENRYGQYNSVRTSLDYNHALLPDLLAFRIAAVDDDEKYQQKPAYQHSRRLFGALRFEPKLFGPDARTSIRLNYELGDIKANRPRPLPPADHITRWFTSGIDENGFANPNKITLDPTTTWTWMSANPGPQATGAVWPKGVAPWWGYAGMGRGGNSSMSFRFDATNATPLYAMTTVLGTAGALKSNGEAGGVMGGVPFTSYYSIAGERLYANYANLLGSAAYQDKSLSDASIFDFYNKLMDGKNKHEYQKWHAGNVAIDQTFFGDRLGFQFVYDMQRYQDGQVGFLNSGEYVLSVDINTKLVDGSPNPNVGRAYVGNSGQYGNTQNYIDRDAMRFTAYGDLRFADIFGKKSIWTRILGHHVVTGLFSQEKKVSDIRNYARWATTPEFAAASHQIYNLNSGTSQVDWVAYLGPSMLNLSSASGLHLSAVTANVEPATYEKLKYFDATWNAAASINPSDPWTYTAYTNTNLAVGPIGSAVTVNGHQNDNPANYVGWTTKEFQILSAENGDIDQLYTSAQKSRVAIKSTGVTYQGYLLDELFVPTVGWRKDTVQSAQTQAPKADGTSNLSLMDYEIDRSAEITQIKESLSYGAVLHAPGFVKKALGGTGLSLFYNRGRNWQAGAPRGGVDGRILPNATGQSKEYGVVVSALNDRISLKVTKYETKVKDATLSSAAGAGFGDQLYYAWALPYWGATHALAALDGLADPQRRQGNWGWPWNGIATLPNGDPDTTRIRQIVSDYFMNFPLDQAFCDEYGIQMDVAKMHTNSEANWYLALPKYGSGSIADGGIGADNGMGLQTLYDGSLRSTGSRPVATADTTSKGYEIELTAQLTKAWSVTANASKTSAMYTAISPSLEAWVNTMHDFYAGDAGLIKLWGGNTFRQSFHDEIEVRYNLLKKQIGLQSTEVPVWRVNLMTNYNFSEGFLKGVNTGVAYRWEDRRVLGYGVDSVGDYDINAPLWGPTDQHFDLWVGYGRDLTPKINWRIQLNVRNVGESAKLVPVSINPNGETALARIQQGMGWTITNTFSF